MSEGKRHSEMGQVIEFPAAKAEETASAPVNKARTEGGRAELTEKQKQIVAQIIRLDLDFDEGLDRLREIMNLIENRKTESVLQPKKLPLHIRLLKRLMARELSRDKTKEAAADKIKASGEALALEDKLDGMKKQRKELLANLSPESRSQIGERRSEKNFADLKMRLGHVLMFELERYIARHNSTVQPARAQNLNESAAEKEWFDEEEGAGGKAERSKHGKGRRLEFSEYAGNGQEAKLFPEEVLGESMSFYAANYLVELNDGLKKIKKNGIAITPDNQARIREALKQGFDRAMILPGLKAQEKVGRTVFISELADKYENKAFISPAYLDATIRQSQKRAGAYLLLYQSALLPVETFKLSVETIYKLFKKRKWDGLTLEEYLILQRQEFKKSNSHSFDRRREEERWSQGTWLLDTIAKNEKVYIEACWNENNKRVEVWAISRKALLVSATNNFGARPVIIVPIEAAKDEEKSTKPAGI